MEQRLSGDQSQDGISQELSSSLSPRRADRVGRTQRLHLARLRTVSKRLLDEFLALEVVSHFLFQRH